MVAISVILPCYNVEEYLEECLDSIVNQTFQDIEIICINDGSTDNTSNILKEYSKNDNRIRIIDQANRGLAISRNVGLDEANGKYVCFIDSDDYFDLNALQELFDLAEEKSLDFVIFKLLNFDNETSETICWDYFEMKFLNERVGDNVFSLEDVDDLLFKMNVTAPGKLFSHKLISGLKFPEGLMWEDNPFFIQVMFRAKRMYFYDKYLYFRRLRDSSMTRSHTENFSDCLVICDIMEDITKENDCYDKYKLVLFRRRLSSAFKRFLQSNPEDKPKFFIKIKEDFSNHKDEFEFEDFFNQSDDRYGVIFNAALNCETPEEFENTVKAYDLKRKNSKSSTQIKEQEEFDKRESLDTSKLTQIFRKVFNKF